MILKDKLFAAGVVGCGGAGFPTHVKLSGEIEHLIINGAECEPLLRTDRYIMTNFASELVRTAEAVRQEISADKCTFGLKSGYKKEIAALKEQISENGLADRIFIHTMDSFYPAGDEQTLVREVTGKTVPPAGIPLDVGCAVTNAATLLCISDALKDIPFTDKFLTVTGEVNHPTVLKVPIGTSFYDCLSLAGGVKCDDYICVSGGPMMGRIIEKADLDKEFVTKTTSGILVLRNDGYIANHNRISVKHMLNRAHSACIQCSYCTQMCPRHLMGHPLEPHKIMRKTALCADINGLLSDPDIKNALLCCECGICETYACPMDLQPRKINSMLKKALGEAGIRYPKGEGMGDESPSRELRKVPSKKAAVRAGVVDYYDYEITELICAEPSEVYENLRQHIGAQSEPLIRDGERVTKGQLIAKCPDGKLGANLHASIDGVASVHGCAIRIVKA
ncbi:MAG: SLBB domain-containing protein [Clostridia bacterium]|nr:SLBB domain-containing protein [Clostridia bacterium]